MYQHCMGEKGGGGGGGKVETRKGNTVFIFKLQLISQVPLLGKCSKDF